VIWRVILLLLDGMDEKSPLYVLILLIQVSAVQFCRSWGWEAAAASPSNFFGGEGEFGQIWLDLRWIWRNLGKISTNLGKMN